jgi:hypothetical protein
MKRAGPVAGWSAARRPRSQCNVCVGEGGVVQPNTLNCGIIPACACVVEGIVRVGQAV